MSAVIKSLTFVSKPLPVLPSAAVQSTIIAPSPAAQWDEFLARRADLTAQMHLHVCDGCDGCGLRCMDGFTVTRHEWDAVKDYLALADLEEVARIAAQPQTVPWPGAEDTGATVTYCRFRDQAHNRCSIYPARPTVCRLFGQVEWLPCPIEAVPSYPASAPAVYNSYRTFERHTFAEWEAFDAAFAKSSAEKELAHEISHTLEGNPAAGVE